MKELQSSNLVGKVGELFLAQGLIFRGYQVAVPIVEEQSSLWVSSPENFYARRIQVRTSASTKPCPTLAAEDFQIRLRPDQIRNPKEAEFLAICLIANRLPITFLVPREVVANFLEIGGSGMSPFKAEGKAPIVQVDIRRCTRTGEIFFGKDKQKNSLAPYLCKAEDLSWPGFPYQRTLP